MLSKLLFQRIAITSTVICFSTVLTDYSRAFIKVISLNSFPTSFKTLRMRLGFGTGELKIVSSSARRLIQQRYSVIDRVPQLLES